MSSLIKESASGKSLDGGGVSSRHGFAARGQDPCDPLQALEIHERAWTAQNLGRAQREQELLGRLERGHANEAGRETLEDVRVGPRAHRQVVFPREAERLVVVALEEEPRVVDLEDVYLGEMAVQRSRARDRV